MYYRSIQLATLAILILFACKNEVSQQEKDQKGEKTLTATSPLLKLLLAEETGIDFQNAIVETFENNITTNINIYNGGGVAVADLNNDGLPDLYFISSTGENKLYQNLGGLKFKDITDGSGVEGEGGFETAVTAVDINTDGYLDLYVCRAGPVEDNTRRNRLYINNGNLTFSEKANEYGLDDISASTGANFFDYDNDGDLDLYLLNYPTDFSFCTKVDVRPTKDLKSVEPNLEPKTPYDTDRLYRNDGGMFKDVSKEAGIWNFAYGLSVAVSDFNLDGYADVYVGNDFIQPDFLYINNGNGTFSNQLPEYFRHTSQHTMGTELSDFDNDGLIDFFAVDMLGNNNFRQKTVRNTNTQSQYTTLVQHGYFEPVVRNVLQRNNGNGTFSDVACLAHVYKTDWSWSGLFADLDNDGWKDLCITNRYRRETGDLDFINFAIPEIKQKDVPLQQQYKDVYDFLKLIPTYKLRNFVFRNNKDWTFEDMSGKWMTMKASWSNGSAVADLDLDGDLDYVVNNLEEPAFIYQNLTNQQSGKNYLQFKLAGAARNPQGIGASVTLFFGDQMQYQEMNPTRGIFSSVEHLLHFGLGEVSQVDKVVVRWPDGFSQTLTDVKANQRMTLHHEEASEKALAQPALAPTLFEDQTITSGLNFRHEENDFNDFEAHFLQPWKLSELGPMMATADVNGDGLTDVFIGNSFDKPAMLFIQNSEGKFIPASTKTWETDQVYEDHGALFLDADGDGDADLYVVSGGTEAVNELAWQDRFYLNDGKGNFTKVAAIPPTKSAGSHAIAYDFDGDGDQDIIRGGRTAISNYPASPKSYILRNDKNRFTDVTDEVSPEFGQVGMITDLVWANIDNDPAAELIVVGEWMPLTVFKIIDGKLKKLDAVTLGFENSNGLWNRLVAADLDQDGDIDLVTGNLGTNTRLTATVKEPLMCYAYDFDRNDAIDAVMAYYEKGQIYPLIHKGVMVKQMPSLKKRFIYAREYAAAAISDIFEEKDLDEAIVMKANMLETCWWENQNGKFVRHLLPTQAQVSPVFGILIYDFNADGHADILLVGNKYGMEVETGRCDAGNGTLLIGDGKGKFAWVNNIQSGFWASKEARDLVLLNSRDGKYTIVVSNNNDAAQVYRRK